MFHSITPLGDCFVSGVSSVFEEYVVCHASAHSVNVHGLKTCSLFAETVLHSSSAFAMAGPFTAGLPGGISSSTMENLPWLASQFPDLPQPSPNMSDASLTSAALRCEGTALSVGGRDETAAHGGAILGSFAFQSNERGSGSSLRSLARFRPHGLRRGPRGAVGSVHACRVVFNSWDSAQDAVQVTAASCASELCSS